MNISKLTRLALLLGVGVAIVAEFVRIPEVGFLLLALGAVSGWNIPSDRQSNVMIAAMLLIGFGGELDTIPVLGDALGGIFRDIGFLALGASIVVISRNIVARIKG